MELRHSSSLGARASSSPMKRDEDASPPIHGTTHDDDDRHHLSRDRDRSFWSFVSDDPRVFSLLTSRISPILIAVFFIVGLISAFFIFNRLVGFWISILKFVWISFLLFYLTTICFSLCRMPHTCVRKMALFFTVRM